MIYSADLFTPLDLQTYSTFNLVPCQPDIGETGVYILQNTMARGGNKNGAGEKMKNEAVRKKKEKGEIKKGKGKRRRVIFFC